MVQENLMGFRVRFSFFVPQFIAVIAVLPVVTSCTSAQSDIPDSAIATADKLVQAAVDSAHIPGAVLLVAHHGEVVHHEAYGFARLYDYGGVRTAPPEQMTTNHVFDLASLTKVFATTFGVMLLVQRYDLDLDSPVYAYLPGFRGIHKDSVTVRHLLEHTGGLYPWKPVYMHAESPESALTYIESLPLAYPVGLERHYSDLGFMMLGYIIERVTGRPVNRFLDDQLYSVLGLHSAMFTPRKRHAGPFAATSHGNPFEYKMIADDEFGYVCDEDPSSFEGWRRRTLQGEVNDGNAFYAHGGVAGHAGLFATAADLNVLMQLLLNEGHSREGSLIEPEIVTAFLTPDITGNGLGWIMTPEILGLEELPRGSFGHTGFTGTYALGVPVLGLSIILLTNRQNLGVDDSGRYNSVNPLRREVATTLIRAAALLNTSEQ
jgi:CubicO group peptidase (beta-lactamase class C family)